VTIGAAASAGSAGKAVGPGSVAGSGGIVPLMAQNEHADQRATTRSAVSAGTIDITDGAHQTQDVASLSRETTNTNGKVSKAPDVNHLLDQQADTMQAAQAAGQVVAQGIGAYADAKRDDATKAVEAAANSNDPQAMAAALADYANWREGGDSRAALQAGGGALIGGLGGGAFGAFAGAAGAAISTKLADQTKAAADAVTATTGSPLIGNVSGNILSGLAGGLVGGSAGAAMASNVNLYNQSRDIDAAAKDAQVKAIVAQALGDRPDFNSVPLGTLIDQFIGQVKLGAQGKMSESPTDLMAQGAANGIAAGIGMGGGKPPTPGASGVKVEGAGLALNAVPGTPGYVPGNATFSKGSDNNTPSPVLSDDPYNPSNVDARVKPAYQTNPAHDTSSPLYNPKKTPEPADAQTAYEDGAVRGGMGTWYAQGETGYYQYFSDNAGTVHFSGTIPASKVPASALKILGK